VLAHLVYLGTVSEFWSLFLVAFLNADSKSRAVFAAATIEFIDDFNVCWKGGSPGVLMAFVMLMPPLISPAPSGSSSIRSKVRLAGTITMAVKGRFGGSPHNGDAAASLSLPVPYAYRISDLSKRSERCRESDVRLGKGLAPHQ